jgi:hypothetical protein
MNAHHQNGIAKHHIHTITERTRTMHIHAMILWPEIIQEQLWPSAIRLSVDLHNCTPGSSGLSPEEIFTGIKGRSRLSDFHPFGCPVFVLDPSLQQGHKIPRWKPRSRVVVYLCLSPDHASSIPLVLSTTSGIVSPQFHVVFDDYFTTTKCLQTNELPISWPTLLATSSEKFVDDSFDSTSFIYSSWFSDTPTANQREDTHSSPSSFQREDTISNHPQTSATSSSSSESDNHNLPPDSSNPSLSLRSGWNPHHMYGLR